jgi:hypothetical protein
MLLLDYKVQSFSGFTSCFPHLLVCKISAFDHTCRVRERKEREVSDVSTLVHWHGTREILEGIAKKEKKMCQGASEKWMS